MDYQDAIRDMLIRSGTQGIKQQAFTIRLTRWATGEEIHEYLEALRAEGKVQKFVDRWKGRQGAPPTYWRATTKILEN